MQRNAADVAGLRLSNAFFSALKVLFEEEEDADQDIQREDEEFFRSAAGIRLAAGQYTKWGKWVVGRLGDAYTGLQTAVSRDINEEYDEQHEHNHIYGVNTILSSVSNFCNQISQDVRQNDETSSDLMSTIEKSAITQVETSTPQVHDDENDYEVVDFDEVNGSKVHFYTEETEYKHYSDEDEWELLSEKDTF